MKNQKDGIGRYAVIAYCVMLVFLAEVGINRLVWHKDLISLERYQAGCVQAAGFWKHSEGTYGLAHILGEKQ